MAVIRELTEADLDAMAGYHMHYFGATWGAGEPTLVIPVEGIKLRKPSDITWTPAYDVELGGVHIGRVVKRHKRDGGPGWDALISNSAYYPAGTELLDRCTQHPAHRGPSWAQMEHAEVTGTRMEAVNAILFRLGQRGAASVAKIIFQARLPWLAEQAAAGETWAINSIKEGASL